MLRLLVLLLLLANLLFFAWVAGWLGEAGSDLRGDKREPQRLSRQVNPESIQIVAEAAPPASATGPAGASSTAGGDASAGALVDAASANAGPAGAAPADAASLNAASLNAASLNAASGVPAGNGAPASLDGAAAAGANKGLAAAGAIGGPAASGAINGPAPSVTPGPPGTPGTPGTPGAPTTGPAIPARPAAPAGPASSVAAASGTAGGLPARNTAPRCLEAGPLTAAQRKDAETALAAVLGDRRWQVRSQEKPGLWMVYMGRFENDEAVKQKMDELRRISTIRVEFSEVRTPPELAPGLSLGRFQQRANAETALVALRSHGVRTARIVTVRQPQAQFFVRLPRATAADQQALVGLSGVLAGQSFAACPATP